MQTDHKNEIKILLNKIATLQNTVENSNNYNVFKVLQLETDEVRLHSRFLGDLLSVHGWHGMQSQFLQSFITAINAQDLFPDLNKVHVHIEKHVGAVTDDSGGQIDILLLDDQNNCLIIENKIYAGDQKHQLLRYQTFARQQENHGGRYKIVYLTLHGNKAHDISIGPGNLHDFYDCISYKRTIKWWLEECLALSHQNEKLHTALNHYYHLIEELTAMNKETKESEIVKEINSSYDTFLAAERISNSLLPAKCNLLNNGIQLIVQKLKISFPELHFIVHEHFGYRHCGLEIHHTIDETNWKSHIRFSFLADASECYMEIHPGFINHVLIPKNHDKRLRYIDLINPYFPTNVGKSLNTENYWQGEWVLHYYPFNNCFDKLIHEDAEFITKIASDIKKVIETFLMVENEFKVANKN